MAKRVPIRTYLARKEASLSFINDEIFIELFKRSIDGFLIETAFPEYVSSLAFFFVFANLAFVMLLIQLELDRQTLNVSLRYRGFAMKAVMSEASNGKDRNL